MDHVPKLIGNDDGIRYFSSNLFSSLSFSSSPSLHWLIFSTAGEEVAVMNFIPSCKDHKLNIFILEGDALNQLDSESLTEFTENMVFVSGHWLTENMETNDPSTLTFIQETMV